jgi:hypothetical protein
MNLLSIDLEFNNKKEILSSGLISSNFFNISSIEENFFNNSSDKKTYSIHGLNSDFLLKFANGSSYNILNNINSHDLLIGFDLKNDFKVLNLNYTRYLFNNKIIDLKLILQSFNIKTSLSNLLIKSKIIHNFKNLLPIHTSIMDSFLSFIFLEHLVVFILKNSSFSIQEILTDLASLSNYFYFKQFWLFEPIIDKYYFLFSLFQEINSNSVIQESTEPFFKLELNQNIEIYNKNFYIIGKYKKEDFSNTENLTSISIKTKNDISIGYRDYIKGD